MDERVITNKHINKKYIIELWRKDGGVREQALSTASRVGNIQLFCIVLSGSYASREP